MQSVYLFCNCGASFCSAFISAAKHHQSAQIIEACQDKEVKNAVFEAVCSGEKEKPLEFLRVCCSVHLLQGALQMFTYIPLHLNCEATTLQGTGPGGITYQCLVQSSVRMCSIHK